MMAEDSTDTDGMGTARAVRQRRRYVWVPALVLALTAVIAMPAGPVSLLRQAPEAAGAIRTVADGAPEMVR
jgi:hypothetical protein